MGIKPQYKEVICNILDATTLEDVGTDNPSYDISIILLLENTNNGLVFQSPLSSDDIQSISGLDRPLNSKEIIETAEKLKNQGKIRLIAKINPSADDDEEDEDLEINSDTINAHGVEETEKENADLEFNLNRLRQKYKSMSSEDIE